MENNMTEEQMIKMGLAASISAGVLSGDMLKYIIKDGGLPGNIERVAKTVANFSYLVAEKLYERAGR